MKNYQHKNQLVKNIQVGVEYNYFSFVETKKLYILRTNGMGSSLASIVAEISMKTYNK